ncbi:hypothetical protein [Phyllobacterium leguminum]|uniref:Uncharacterized protein n=1 Tax=Phyllobacterium leguminum TaxID=314237 RepID=A0A318T3X6_9HYPH|nr:hypothetical protein [Phyllobacterium leguminum]PYE89573.1 hypothetical protein C7477_10381 [Phyllobacterium leguminum]
MRSVDIATAAAYQSRRAHIPRYFVWIEAKNRSTGGLEMMGLWNGEDTVTVTVVDPGTGLPSTRVYHAGGSLLNIDPIPAVSDLSVRTIQIGLSQINAAVQQAIRGYDVRLAKVQIHRGLLDLETRLLVGNPLSLWDGQVNGAPVDTPAVGEEGGIALSVVSHTRMLTRTNPAKRSDETQKLRGGDRARRYSGVAGEWAFWWGEEKKT